MEISRQEEDSDDWIGKSDLIRVYKAPGSSLEGTFPGYHISRFLSEVLSPLGFGAAVIAEGSQGASLAVFNPADVEIINVTMIKKDEPELEKPDPVIIDVELEEDYPLLPA